MENFDKINELNRKLEILLKKQDDFNNEINELKNELLDFKTLKGDKKNLVIKPEETFYKEPVKISTPPPIEKKPIEKIKTTSFNFPKISVDLEKFIGENLISKIGIIITIIGVVIGTKYSIEHDLISPLTRIILGYLVGIGLLAFGIKLKKKYTNFSAVLVSGAMAILYFITYSAYSFYDLIPQLITFILMAVFTVFTVIAALNYNKQVIAHIGLVGAYAVPFLLSNGSGNTVILFCYMSIINLGILFIAFKKYWKPLYYAAFVITWLIFTTWFVSEYNTNTHFYLALSFLFIFFTIFYITFLAYKILQKATFEIGDIIVLLLNSFIFYGFGYVILNGHETGEQLLGLFTLGNAIIHFIVCAIIYTKKLADKNLFYFVSGLVLVFITIAIPVQLNGNWVTLLWVGEAALLFWIGRTKNIATYEKLSYPLMFLSVFSIFQDWEIGYGNMYSETTITPIFNIHFLTSALFIVAFSFINYINFNKKQHTNTEKKNLKTLFSIAIPTILITIIYFAFRIEISNYWDQLYASSKIVTNSNLNSYPTYNNNLRDFKSIWILNYSLLFLTILSFINIKKIKNIQLGIFNLALNTFAIVIFLFQGLYILSELRENYLNQRLSEYYEIGNFYLIIRYISFAFLTILLVACYKYIKAKFIHLNLKLVFELFFYSVVLWIASSELIHWMDIFESTQSYKLGLSILWGIYSLILIALGIWKNKKHLRIGAIVLFSVTLIKLFLYDVSHLNTISKTILFVSLGILLLIISFLYNKFKHKITDEN